MATVFQNILNNAARKGITDQYTSESINWFRINIRKTAVSPLRVMKEERDNYVTSWSSTAIGKMYFAYYDPKHKDTLPYYDMFPLIIPIKRLPDGFLGLNLHYLPPILRAKLLDSLYDLLNNAKLDEHKRFIISYNILQATSKHRYFKPCVKRYLGKHFRSRFIKIPHENWTAAVFLPTETFEKKSKNEVWSDSRQSISRSR